MASTNARLLFGLAAASCGAPHAHSSGPAYPLCDHDGAPACGNVGQVGRAREPAPRVRIQQVVLAAASELRPVRGSLLVSGANQDLAMVRPLVDDEDRAMSGNIGKGRHRPQVTVESAAMRARSRSILAEVLALAAALEDL